MISNNAAPRQQLWPDQALIGQMNAATRQQPWTDMALKGQMSVLNSILQSSQVDLKYLSNQCLLLSKIIDSLVANNWKPSWRSEILPLMRKVCKHKDSADARPALFILLLSVKGAFRAEWLTSVQITENDEIFTTLKLLFDSFTTGHDVSEKTPMQLLQCGGSGDIDFQEARVYLDTISNRFYPRLQLSSIFVAVHAKVGYEVLMCDFNVPRMHVKDRVRLYVGQKEITETSTCIITPVQVNFLVNGQQVEKRVSAGYLDAGPQMPSDVTNLVKVGPNVVQVIGEFSVSYVIAVASSRAIERSSKNAELQDYVAPTKAASEVDPSEVDDEVVEGASRVSLRCPISLQRLVMPVKATTCRHLQCFDYDSFLEINENRPAWRCPCCNSFISCPDLRIDRQMEKVLKDTDERIYEVIFNQDGSWVPVSPEDDETDRGPDVVILEGGERGRKYIDLSDVDDEESYRTRQKSDVFQQHERKPDAQNLQAMLENALHTTNPVVRQPDPVVNVPESTTVAPRSSSSFSGHVWVGGINEGTFVNANGAGLYTPTSGTGDNQVQNQPASSIQSMSTINHNFQIRFPRSRTAPQGNSPAGPVNRLVSNGGCPTFTQLQPPQSSAPPNIGLVAENGWVRQRQVGQQSPGTSQNVQDLGQMRPQWRSTGVPPTPQIGTSTGQSHNLHSSQHLYSNQSQVLQSPRQHSSPGTVPHHQHASSGNVQQQRSNPGINVHHQHANPGTSQSQRPSPGINSHHHHAASVGTSHQPHSSPGASHHHAASVGTSHQPHSSPGASQHQHSGLGHSQQQQRPTNSQQRSGLWGSANVGQWHPTTSSVYQAQALGVPAASEQTWRPAQRMRGSVANPSLGHTALGPSSSAVQQQRAPSVTSFHGFNAATNANSVSVPRFQIAVPISNNQAANVSLYNGTTWVNAPDFSAPQQPAQRFTGLETAEGWHFEDIDAPGPPQ